MTHAHAARSSTTQLRRQASPVAPAQAGFSMVELIVAATILILMVLMVSTLMLSGSDASKFAERNNRATEVGQDLIDNMRSEIRAATRIFTNDSTGTAYRAVLEPWTSASPIATTTLPTLDVLGSFQADSAGTNKTGNELLLSRHSWSAEFTTTGGTTYRYDVLRIVRYFLKTEDGGPRVGSPWGLNLVHWVSEPMVDGTQIDNITNTTDQKQVLLHLRNGTADKLGKKHPKVDLVWRMGQDPATTGTLRQITSLGALSNTPLSPRAVSWRILRDSTKSSAGMLFYRHHSIATNYSLPSYRVPKYGIGNNTSTGFPHGFEIQVIGPSSARQVLLRLVIVSTNRQGHVAHADLQAILGARDL